jgi:rhodanese-related sulfurtransferase
MKKAVVWSLLIMATALFAAYPVTAAETGSPAAQSHLSSKVAAGELLDPKDAFGLIQKNKTNPNFVVLDVRRPDEYSSGHIESAININYESGGFKTELLELDKKKTYLVYCRTGRRSGQAVRLMKELGFENIIRMKGDILKWQSENLPLVK